MSSEEKMEGQIAPAGRLNARKALRSLRPDYIHESLILEKFVNRVMKQGKKTKARRLVYGALVILERKKAVAGMSGIDLFHEAIANIKPALEVRSKRVGGASYSIPVPVSAKRSLSLAIRALVNAFRKRSEKNMEERLAMELVEAYEKRGGAFKWRESLHSMANANRVFLGMA